MIALFSRNKGGVLGNLPTNWLFVSITRGMHPGQRFGSVTVKGVNVCCRQSTAVADTLLYYFSCCSYTLCSFPNSSKFCQIGVLQYTFDSLK